MPVCVSMTTSLCSAAAAVGVEVGEEGGDGDDVDEWADGAFVRAAVVAVGVAVGAGAAGFGAALVVPETKATLTLLNSALTLAKTLLPEPAIAAHKGWLQRDEEGAAAVCARVRACVCPCVLMLMPLED